MVRRAITVAAIIVCLGSFGCESHSENKKLALKRWQKASVGIKLNLAQQAYEKNQFEKAIQNVYECIITDPNNAQAHLLYGKLLLTKGERADAERELQLAVELDEQLGEGWYWLGRVTDGLVQTQQSLFYYKKALALDPARVDYVLAVAETYAKQEKLEDAIKLLEEKVATEATAADLTWASENELAIELYKQAMPMRDGDGSIAEALGYCYVFSGRWDEGAKIFNELVEQCRDEQKKKLYLFSAALCNMNCARYDKAVDFYNELSIKEKDNAEIWVKMGQAALGTGDAKRAFMCGEKALTLQPSYADAIALKGCAQYLMGYYYAAIKSFEKIASDKKNGGISWLMRARCYEQLDRKDEARQAYKKALEIEPHSKLGDFLAKRKNVGNLSLWYMHD